MIGHTVTGGAPNRGGHTERGTGETFTATNKRLVSVLSTNCVYGVCVCGVWCVCVVYGVCVCGVCVGGGEGIKNKLKYK